jgi:hypothetical protein
MGVSVGVRVCVVVVGLFRGEIGRAGSPLEEA